MAKELTPGVSAGPASTPGTLRGRRGRPPDPAATRHRLYDRQVTSPIPQASRREGALLLADISGYTGFLQGVTDAHRALIVDADQPPPAYAVLSHLLDTMVGAIAPTFRLAKFEGDAIFAVADDGTADGQAVLRNPRPRYAAFR